MTVLPVPRKLLVLDLDETLIFATEVPLAHEADFRVGPYFVYRRPHLEAFVASMRQHFDLAVWTSSGGVYAQQVVEQIFPTTPLQFVWASRRCTMSFDPVTGDYVSTKNLRKLRRLGYRLESVVVVDDTPEKYRRSYGNLVCVREFNGEEEDTELKWLALYLPTLTSVQNVRAVEKRGWRKRTEAAAANPIATQE